MITADMVATFPRPLTDYLDPAGASLIDVLIERIKTEPFNAIATGVFVLAIAHTFAAARFTALAHRHQHRHDERSRASGRPCRPSVIAEVLHFFGEIEVVFGLWAVVLLLAITGYAGWRTAQQYVSETVDYTEPIFVVVIMAIASTRPIVGFAEAALRRLANTGGATPASWWLTILIVGPILGSFITEPAAMTICALLLARQFFDLQPSTPVKYATLGLLFVNVSIGGTFTHFAAPPVLMVARPWNWNLTFMVNHFGWRAGAAILVSTLLYFFVFRTELRSLTGRSAVPDIDHPDDDVTGEALLPVPGWLIAVHLLFMTWTVVNAHEPALLVGGFLFFLGFARATATYQTRIELRTPLLVGFFLAGLVIHGGLQGWWIAPILTSLSQTPLFIGATVLTAFNDNALITYLATLVPDLDLKLKLAIVGGAVTGGGLTVIANAPNPAGQALLIRFFGGAVSPIGVALGALVPTLITAMVLRWL